jgi:hypothetical protein
LFRSGRKGLKLAQVQAILGSAASGFAVDFGLFLAEGIAFAAAARCRLDAAQTTPAIALAGREETHLGFVVMGAAAVAKNSFSHHSLRVSKMCGSMDRPCFRKMTKFACHCVHLVTASQHILPKLNAELTWEKQ